MVLRQKGPFSRGKAMQKNKVVAIATMGFALLIVFGAAYRARSQDAETPYPKMAPIQEYLMDRTAEITLARSAAPESISRDATVLVLGRQGYETAVQGKNGFVCWVGRGWGAAFDWAEFWNPKVRAADSLNPQAARSILPIVYLRARMVMSGRSKAEIVSALKEVYEKKELPDVEIVLSDRPRGPQHAPSHVLHSRQGRERLGFWRSGFAGYVQSLLVLFSQGRIPNERAATDPCVPRRGHKLVRRNACGPAQ